jgi:taurine dioxygenase
MVEYLVKPLSEHFGAVISDCDVAGLDARDVDGVRWLLYENKVLLFKRVSMDPPAYIRFAGLLGDIVPFVDPDYHHPDYQQIFVVSNINRDGQTCGKDRVGYYWHSDSSFLNNPLPITMLHAQQVPDEGGQTAFIDMSHVYAALPEDIRAFVDAYSARHEGKWKYLITKDDVGLSIEDVLERDEQMVPSSVHPLTVAHPVTGRKALYFSEGVTRRVIGISAEASEELLGHLIKYVVNDTSRYIHRWEEGDLLIWDNRSVIHHAYPAAAGQPRLMFRIGVSDRRLQGVVTG